MTFPDVWTVLMFQDISHYLIEELISTGSHFFLMVNKFFVISLNYATYFRHVHKLKHNLYLRPFNMFSFMKSSILTIMFLAFFWSLYCTSLVRILYILLQTILAFTTILILEVIYSGIFWKVNWSFFGQKLLVIFCFFLVCNLHKPSLYITTYFGYRQCFIWKFLVSVSESS